MLLMLQAPTRDVQQAQQYRNTHCNSSSSNGSGSISSRSSNNSSLKGLQHHQRFTNMSIRILEGQAAVAAAAAAAAVCICVFVCVVIV
jgi:hypothetical protein